MKESAEKVTKDLFDFTTSDGSGTIKVTKEESEFLKAVESGEKKAVERTLKVFETCRKKLGEKYFLSVVFDGAKLCLQKEQWDNFLLLVKVKGFPINKTFEFDKTKVCSSGNNTLQNQILGQTFSTYCVKLVDQKKGNQLLAEFLKIPLFDVNEGHLFSSACVAKNWEAVSILLDCKKLNLAILSHRYGEPAGFLFPQVLIRREKVDVKLFEKMLNHETINSSLLQECLCCVLSCLESFKTDLGWTSSTRKESYAKMFKLLVKKKKLDFGGYYQKREVSEDGGLWKQYVYKGKPEVLGNSALRYSLSRGNPGWDALVYPGGDPLLLCLVRDGHDKEFNLLLSRDDVLCSSPQIFEQVILRSLNISPWFSKSALDVDKFFKKVVLSKELLNHKITFQVGGPQPSEQNPKTGLCWASCLMNKKLLKLFLTHPTFKLQLLDSFEFLEDLFEKNIAHLDLEDKIIDILIDIGKPKRILMRKRGVEKRFWKNHFLLKSHSLPVTTGTSSWVSSYRQIHSPLVLACIGKRDDIVLRLLSGLKISAERKAELLIHAIDKNLKKVVSELLKDRKLNLTKNQTNAERRISPLCFAALKGREEILKLMVTHQSLAKKKLEESLGEFLQKFGKQERIFKLLFPSFGGKVLGALFPQKKEESLTTVVKKENEKEPEEEKGQEEIESKWRFQKVEFKGDKVKNWIDGLCVRGVSRKYGDIFLVKKVTGFWIKKIREVDLKEEFGISNFADRKIIIYAIESDLVLSKEGYL